MTVLWQTSFHHQEQRPGTEHCAETLISSSFRTLEPADPNPSDVTEVNLWTSRLLAQVGSLTNSHRDISSLKLTEALLNQMDLLPRFQWRVSRFTPNIVQDQLKLKQLIPMPGLVAKMCR
jgi:hypothetical protein